MGGSHRAAVAATRRTWKRKEFVCEECAQRRGNCFRWKVAATKPKAQPCHRQDSRQAKDVLAARSRKETWPTSASPHDGFAGWCPDAGKANINDKARTPLAAAGGNMLEAWRGRFMK